MAPGIMGSNHRKSGRNSIIQRRIKRENKLGRFIRDAGGDAVVEATILFPIMTMIFAGLVLLSIFLPAQSVLQRATQYTATAIATEISDTWLFYDQSNMSYYWETNKNRLTNVYADLFTSRSGVQSKGEVITRNIESRSISSKAGQLSVVCYEDNKIIYREIVVTASREFPMPVDLSLIGFPKTITITATSTVAVQNANEFVWNIDLASDFAVYIIEKYELHDITGAIGSFGSKVASLLGW